MRSIDNTVLQLGLDSQYYIAALEGLHHHRDVDPE